MTFRRQQTFPLGLNANGRIKTYAGHFYPQIFQVDANGNIPFDMPTLLMNHTSIADDLDLYKPYISYLAQNTSSQVPYVLSEVGNSAVVGPNVGIDVPKRNNLGTALWGVDYNLYAMSIVSYMLVYKHMIDYADTTSGN